MPELFNCVDVLVLPSYREGFSRVILEASACGVPVIASDVRGCRDAVVNGLTGILIPPHNAAKVTEAVINLLQDNARSTQLGQQARLYAEKYFDQNVVIEHIRTTYETLLKNASGKLK
jgi:glycosyltransferase involved in cell wall biosynthesis